MRVLNRKASMSAAGSAAGVQLLMKLVELTENLIIRRPCCLLYSLFSDSMMAALLNTVAMSFLRYLRSCFIRVGSCGLDLWWRHSQDQRLFGFSALEDWIHNPSGFGLGPRACYSQGSSTQPYDIFSPGLQLGLIITPTVKPAGTDIARVNILPSQPIPSFSTHCTFNSRRSGGSILITSEKHGQ
jgi:hypothetical protein